ncbi:MAG TPA: hypothetical protein VKB93_29515 [Thermoanaerobaculia bacterium]|nr:hypothetical protein [Thermoanaerobaculia bacterium]
MTKRLFLGFLCFFAVAITANAASDDACTRDTLTRVSARLHIDVVELFEKSDAVPAQPEGMELLIARIGPDGKPVLACVDGAEAAKKFLEAPMEKVARRAKEQ